jgi:glutathione S-transferase
MYKLFARSGAGSVIVEALLEEAGVDYQIVAVERGTGGPEGFLRINPLGQVPALVLPDGTVMTESAAIAIHLADLHPQLRLAPPPDSPKRPVYLRWMVYLAANIYASDLRIYYSSRYSTDPSHCDAVKAAAEIQMAKEWDLYAAALGAGPYILGAEPTAVDIYAAMLATWNLDVPAFFRDHPNIKAMYDRIAERPAVARVWKRNDMDSWAAQAATA